MDQGAKIAGAIVVAALIVAGGLFLGLQATTPRYQIVATGAGYIARLDRDTGNIEGCFGPQCVHVIPASAPTPTAAQLHIAEHPRDDLPSGYTLDNSAKP